MSTDDRHHRDAVRVRLIALLLTLAALLPPGVARASSAQRRSVIVQAAVVETAANAVRAAGGRVTARLSIVGGVVAELDRRGERAVARSAGVIAVTPNEPIRFAGLNGSDNPHTVNSVFNEEINSQELWERNIGGRGVRIALVDTGVSAMPGLTGRIVPVPDPVVRGQTAPCVNFSGEETCADSYGHGTFIAGLIAGDGAGNSERSGVAPAAEIVSLKIAGRDGSADITKVLAAIQYVVSFREQLGIRVLNLSLGTNSTVHWRIDPLNRAVQRAWQAGIVVVVSAGNRGPKEFTISKPADDPYVISVGAVDDRETPATDDDRMPRFSSRGPTAHGIAKPDVVAPGGRLVSLRSKGSYVEEQVPGGVDGTFRRGSGTSMSAGVVSGAAALLLDAHPAWTPDQVKFALTSTAVDVAVGDRNAIGRGLIDVEAAHDASAAPPQSFGSSDGSGLLDGTRADVLVTRACMKVQQIVDPACDHVHGQATAQDHAFDADEYANGEWTEDAWYDGQWAAGLLRDPSWAGSSWYGSSWYGSSWYGSSWYGNEDDFFYGTSVAGSSWYGAWS